MILLGLKNVTVKLTDLAIKENPMERLYLGQLRELWIHSLVYYH